MRVLAEEDDLQHSHPRRRKMRKTDQKAVEAIRTYVVQHPELVYSQVATSFGVSLATVKRVCGGLGRGKDWRRKQRKPMESSQKFWDKVDRSSDCWPYMGSRNSSGYGSAYHDGAIHPAHRVAYFLEKGPIPDGLELDHKCRNRTCCNPDHLELVTRQENMRRVRTSRESPPEYRDSGAQKAVANRAGGAKLIVNDDQDQARDLSASRRPRSYSYRPPGADLLERAWAEAEEQRKKQGAEDLRWGITETQLAHEKAGGNRLILFVVKNEEDGVSVLLAARSAKFARQMFESVWGSHFDVTVGEAGNLTIPPGVAPSYTYAWRQKLSEERRTWESTTKGKECGVRRARESGNRIAEENLRVEIEWCEQEQELLVEWEEEVARAKRAAERKSRSCVKCPNCNGHISLDQTRAQHEGNARRESFPDECDEEEYERSHHDW